MSIDKKQKGFLLKSIAVAIGVAAVIVLEIKLLHL
jgi:hypothetical protein